MNKCNLYLESYKMILYKIHTNCLTNIGMSYTIIVTS